MKSEERITKLDSFVIRSSALHTLYLVRYRTAALLVVPGDFAQRCWADSRIRRFSSLAFFVSAGRQLWREGRCGRGPRSRIAKTCGGHRHGPTAGNPYPSATQPTRERPRRRSWQCSISPSQPPGGLPGVCRRGPLRGPALRRRQARRWRRGCGRFFAGQRFVGVEHLDRAGTDAAPHFRKAASA